MTGKAYLVGAGPGRADLISVRGLALLRAADVVIFDRLIARELLQELRPQAERIFVGKQGHRPNSMPQDEINALLVSRVQAGSQVVRLKGGDGFVFGRGGEECLALAAAGLPFEIVPGVSAAIAAPAFAGIPVTHRDLASAFVVVTGNEDPAKEETSVDWSQLAQLPTLVVMMGARRVSVICETLGKHGRDPASPAAAIGSATTRQQRVVCSTLAGLPQAMARAQIHAPAVLVFGDVVTLRDRLDWFTPDIGGAGFLPMERAVP